MSGLKIKSVAQVRRPVTVHVPADMGEFVEKQMLVTYRLLSETERSETFDGQSDSEKSDPKSLLMSDVLRRDILAIEKLRDVVDVEGDLETVAISDLVTALLDVRYIAEALVAGYFDAQNNRKAIAEKN